MSNGIKKKSYYLLRIDFNCWIVTGESLIETMKNSPTNVFQVRDIANSYYTIQCTEDTRISVQELYDIDDEIRMKDDQIHDLKEKVHQLELALERKEKEYMILEDSYHCRIKDWEELCEGTNKLEKALDKTCELLNGFTTCPFDDLGIEIKRCSSYCEDNEHGECWKEWCLDEIN